jgi:hypothetical protein
MKAVPFFPGAPFVSQRLIVVFDLHLGLALVRPGLEQSDLRVPFLQLRIYLFFVCFSLSFMLICS